MNHSGKFEPNRYFDAQLWGDKTAAWVNDLLGFSLTDKQKKEIAQAMANWYGDIVQDERNDICAELEKEAQEAHGSTERAVYRTIVQALKVRGRE